MIDRQKDRIVVECDSCDSVHEGEPHEEFTDVWSRAKRDGWRTRQVGNDWVHSCEKCSEKV